jgi:hypothetical protein
MIGKRRFDLFNLFKMRQCGFGVGRCYVGVAIFAFINCLIQMFDCFFSVRISLGFSRTLIGKKPGDSVEVNTPGGGKSYEIVNVAFQQLTASAAGSPWRFPLALTRCLPAPQRTSGLRPFRFCHHRRRRHCAPAPV